MFSANFMLRFQESQWAFVPPLRVTQRWFGVDPASSLVTGKVHRVVRWWTFDASRCIFSWWIYGENWVWRGIYRPVGLLWERWLGVLPGRKKRWYYLVWSENEIEMDRWINDKSYIRFCHFRLAVPILAVKAKEKNVLFSKFYSFLVRTLLIGVRDHIGR